jgi:hypothetical protein
MGQFVVMPYYLGMLDDKSGRGWGGVMQGVQT